MEAVPITEVTGREIILHGVRHTGEEIEEEDVVEFDLEEEDEQAEAKELAMVRFYLGKKYNVRGLFEEMRVAWGLHSMKPVQVLGDNKFLLEFDSEMIKQCVVEGGPWRHKGDTSIVVSYDGFSPPSAIVLSTIGLWVKFYDMPAVLRKEDYVQKLALWLGQARAINMSFPNYVRVHVLFPLATTLVLEVKIRFKGKGGMRILVCYENVSFFCFICGRIGHSDKECPDGEVGNGAFNYGVDLRASPPNHLREVRVQTRPVASQFLNFEGDQRAKL
jgi:hypothetical protein